MESDAETGKKKQRKSWRLINAARGNLFEFCRSTSLHGLQYVGDSHRPLFERLFWLLIFLISVVTVAFFILKIWKKWDSTPVFVSFAETTTPIWDIPFPAITICPEVKIKETVFNYTEMYYKTNKTYEEYLMFQKSKLVCRSMLEFGLEIQLFLEDDNSSTVEGIYEFFKEVAPALDESLLLCNWRGEKIFGCDDMFKPIVTDDGLCFSFNMLNYKELFREGVADRDKEYFQQQNSSFWSLEKGYNDTESTNVYPRRSMRPGARGGLSLFLAFNVQDLGTLCNLATHGVKVVVHNPTDVPSIHDQYFRVNMDNDVVVGIKPRVMTTSEALHSYPPKRRQCYYPTERHLQYFNMYSEDNCQLECFTNYTLELCRCVAFFMPRTEDIPICGISNFICTEAATDLFTADDRGLEMCDCLPSCIDVRYDVETSQASANISNSLASVLSALGVFSIPFTDLKMSKVSFYYKDGQFVTSHRSELFGPAEFLASCGGLLGLYLGFSLLSLVEIIYFFTVRVISNIRKHHKESKYP